MQLQLPFAACSAGGRCVGCKEDVGSCAKGAELSFAGNADMVLIRSTCPVPTVLVGCCAKPLSTVQAVAGA